MSKFYKSAAGFPFFIQNFLLFGMIFSASNLSAQAPVITAVSPSAATVEQYGKIEIKLELTATYTNPYDYDNIRVAAIFTGPDNRSVPVEGFFMQDFQFTSIQTGTISPINTGVFKIRFSPNQPGIWRYTASCTTAAGTGTFPEQTFQCAAPSNASNKGFVRTGESHYLQFDNAQQYIPVGENMAWQVSNPYVDYKKWLDKLSENQGNFCRIWQAHWGLGIEWQNNNNGFQGLRRYKQSNAFYLDWLFDYCAEKGIYALFCIQHHGQVSSRVNPNWSESPYNAANGGPAQNTWDFFTNTTAKNHVKNRLRYILARWGYSRNVLSWELFNEVNWTDQFEQHKVDVANWHAEMAAFLKDNDPYEHLVTTSYADDQYDPAVWHNPDIDFTQTHYYINVPNPERTYSKGIKNYLTSFQKPTLVGEFGLGDSGSGLGTLDPNGIHIHNSLWASLFSGGMGTAMTWWWDNYIEPRNLYYHFAPIAEVASVIPFKDKQFVPVAASVQGVPANLTLSPTQQGWGALADTVFAISENGVITPAGANLSSILYGSQWNTQYRRPPVFQVNYPINGKFIVKTATQTGNSPKIAIWLDGVKKLEQNAAVNQSYSIDVPAGTHTIKVDNTGTDWVGISSYFFTGLGSAVDAYTLISKDQSKVVGWVLNSSYNHDFVKNNGIPVAATGAILTVGNVKNGSYQVKWIDCLSGAVVNTAPVTVEAGSLHLLIPRLLWDLAFTMEDQLVGVSDLKQALPFTVYPNPVSTSQLNTTFELKTASQVQISLLDASERALQTLHSGLLPAGEQHISSNLTGSLPAGMYWIKITTERQAATQPLVIVKP